MRPLRSRSTARPDVERLSEGQPATGHPTDRSQLNDTGSRPAAAYTEAHRDEVDEHVWRLVVCNGFHAQRGVTTAAGAVPVK